MKAAYPSLKDSVCFKLKSLLDERASYFKRIKDLQENYWLALA